MHSFKTNEPPFCEEGIAVLAAESFCTANQISLRQTSTVCPRPKPKRKSPPGSKKKISARTPSITNCATGCSAVSVTGASRSRLFGKRTRTAILSRSVAGKFAAAVAAVARRLQAHHRWPATARPREGLVESARRLGARNQHDAAMGRLVLVLSPLSRREKFRSFRWQGSGELLDGRGVKVKCEIEIGHSTIQH